MSGYWIYIIIIIGVIMVSVGIPYVDNNITPIIFPTMYEKGVIEKSFNYTLRGDHNSIKVNLYKGVYDKILPMSKSLYCDSNSCTFNEYNNFYLSYLNCNLQTKYMDDLVGFIKSKTSDRDDQVRIAVSIVQNIPYVSNSNVKYPYVTLYDNSGDCDDKSLLLAYILKELGYDTTLFVFDSESHMAVGIKSSEYFYDDTEYAFIESTTPSIITDSSGEYSVSTSNFIPNGNNFIVRAFDTPTKSKLYSHPMIIKATNGGYSMNVEEDYTDMVSYSKLESSSSFLPPDQYRQWEILSWKYGIKYDDGSTILQDPSNKPLCDDGILCNNKCYESCGLNRLPQCTSNGVVCDLDPVNCPIGTRSCNNQCWESSCIGNWVCESQGPVCYYWG